MSRSGKSRPGKARRGNAVPVWHGWARKGQDRRGKVRIGKAGEAWSVGAGTGEDKHGMARQSRIGEAGRGGDGQGKARQANNKQLKQKNKGAREMATKKQATEKPIEIIEVKKEFVRVGIIGTTPIILNRMSEKTRQELLLPKGRKTAAEKKGVLKHDPIEEYRSSPYRMPEDQPTYLGFMCSAFKGAMRVAALDLPGSSKAQIGRLVYVEGDLVPLYGIPKLFMAITRQAGMNATPDVRTRAIIPRWGVVLDISFVTPIMKQPSVLNILAAAGITSGVGDWRPEKGKGDYGQFRVVNHEDPELVEIINEGSREAQIEAMQNPTPYDIETQELLGWFIEEAERRGYK